MGKVDNSSCSTGNYWSRYMPACLPASARISHTYALILLQPRNVDPIAPNHILWESSACGILKFNIDASWAPNLVRIIQVLRNHQGKLLHLYIISLGVHKKICNVRLPLYKDFNYNIILLLKVTLKILLITNLKILYEALLVIFAHKS